MGLALGTSSSLRGIFKSSRAQDHLNRKEPERDLRTTTARAVLIHAAFPWGLHAVSFGRLWGCVSVFRGW